MTIVDANVLLYAVNATSVHHHTAKQWLDRALTADARVGLPWLVLLAFLRIATHPSIFPRPLSLEQALAVVAAWTACPNVVHPEPTRGFVATFAETLADGGAAGNLVNDAYVAALAVEHGATVVTFDRDFARFAAVATLRPPDVPA